MSHLSALVLLVAAVVCLSDHPDKTVNTIVKTVNTIGKTVKTFHKTVNVVDKFVNVCSLEMTEC